MKISINSSNNDDGSADNDIMIGELAYQLLNCVFASVSTQRGGFYQSTGECQVTTGQQ